MKFKLLIFSLLLVFFASLALQGCASTQKNKTLSSFDSATKRYGRLIRWKEYEAAVNMIRHQDESSVEVDIDAYKDLRVTDYEIKKVTMGDELKTAVVDAEITYYFETAITLKTIRDSQNWWYSEEAEQWYLDDELPAF